MKKYHALLKKIHRIAGAREDESQDALELVVENVAVHLSDRTRHNFASQLPRELQTAAMMVPTLNYVEDDIIEQYMELDDVDERRARDYLRAAWQTIIELFDRESIGEIIAELPRDMIVTLEHRTA